MSTVRDDNETTTRPVQAAAELTCPVCGALFGRNRRQTYCSPACKQIAWRARHHPDQQVPAAAGRRRERTIYACTDCDTRYLGEQWCTDCVRPCRSLGPGGECGHCGELLTVEELLTGQDLT